MCICSITRPLRLQISDGPMKVKRETFKSNGPALVWNLTDLVNHYKCSWYCHSMGENQVEGDKGREWPGCAHAHRGVIHWPADWFIDFTEWSSITLKLLVSCHPQGSWDSLNHNAIFCQPEYSFAACLASSRLRLLIYSTQAIHSQRWSMVKYITASETEFQTQQRMHLVITSSSHECGNGHDTLLGYHSNFGSVW